MKVPILRLRQYLVAAVQADLTDEELTFMRRELSARVGEQRIRGVIIDVSLLDVIDSFAARTIGSLAVSLRLRGAQMVLVGIQPDVAFAMVQLGITLPGIATALDLDEGLERLDESLERDAADAG
jgi:rsbT antagonist protein RsbS